MKTPLIFLNPLGLAMAISLASCAGSPFGSAVNSERLHMKIKEQKNVIVADQLKSQKVLTMDERAEADKDAPRGPLATMSVDVISLATDAIKNIIANDKKRYNASYSFGLTDLYFYDQLSNEGAFDPVGMQFSGFRIFRTFKNAAGDEDTALAADFGLDTTNSYEIINNSSFHLKLRDFHLRFAKAKIPKGGDNKLNLDFEITFLTSYVNSQGLIFDSAVLGKFYLFVRNAPLDSSSPGYAGYYASMKDSSLTGRSFIIPRSFGYHREPDGQTKPSYSRGQYSIEIKVKESSKNRFVNKVLLENANIIIDAGGSSLKAAPVLKKL